MSFRWMILVANLLLLLGCAFQNYRMAHRQDLILRQTADAKEVCTVAEARCRQFQADAPSADAVMPFRGVLVLRGTCTGGSAFETRAALPPPGQLHRAELGAICARALESSATVCEGAAGLGESL